MTPLSRAFVLLLPLAFVAAAQGQEPVKKFQSNGGPLLRLIDPRTATCNGATEEAKRRGWINDKYPYKKHSIEGTERGILRQLDELLAMDACGPLVVLELPREVEITPAVLDRLRRLKQRSGTDVVFIVCPGYAGETPAQG